jgi:hypothetical protein
MARTVSSIGEKEVEVIDLQPAQGSVARLHHVLAREALGIGSVAAPEDLARDDEAFVRPAHFLEDVAHDDFRSAGRVGLGIVEEIDAVIIRLLHEIGGDVVADLLSERDPGTE